MCCRDECIIVLVPLYRRKREQFHYDLVRINRIKKVILWYLQYEVMSISCGNSPMFTSNLSWTSFKTLASVSSETNVIARPLVPNLPARATWRINHKLCDSSETRVPAQNILYLSRSHIPQKAPMGGDQLNRYGIRVSGKFLTVNPGVHDPGTGLSMYYGWLDSELSLYMV